MSKHTVPADTQGGLTLHPAEFLQVCQDTYICGAIYINSIVSEKMQN